MSVRSLLMITKQVDKFKRMLLTIYSMDCDSTSHVAKYTVQKIPIAHSKHGKTLSKEVLNEWITDVTFDSFNEFVNYMNSEFMAITDDGATIKILDGIHRVITRSLIGESDFKNIATVIELLKTFFTEGNLKNIVKMTKSCF